jgi:hypothetical protein
MCYILSVPPNIDLFSMGDSFTCISPEEMGKQVLPITSYILNLNWLFKMHNMPVSQLHYILELAMEMLPWSCPVLFTYILLYSASLVVCLC